MKRFLGVMVATVAIAGAARSANAQVGYPPEKSPFVDIEQKHEITPLFGYYRAKRDPAGTAPQSGGLAGLQYEWRATGPLHLGTGFMVVNSSRTRFNPALPAASRDLGARSQPLYAADAFLAVSLTGGRSWHGVMPMIGGGLGLISDTKKADIGGFKFGTRFAFPWSVGVRWLPGAGNFQLRADVKDWMYTIAYPQSYYISTTSDAAILSSDTPTSRWTNNFAMTVGVSYIFKR